jgi:hypothetical protein
MISVMRRVILLIAAILLASVGRSQTMTITLNDGSTVKYDMNNVKSIEFTNDNSGSGQETTPSLVGTWDAVSSRFYNDDGWEEIEDETGYWVFTETTVTDHSEDSLLEGATMNYTFDGEKLVIGGVFFWDVIKFTGYTMVLRIKIIGAYQEMTLKKR